MPRKTHHTALAIVPPQDAWGPIQAIRERHDRQVGRWPPHINLLYPFFSSEQFDDAMPRLTAACAQIEPFIMTLAEFHFFQHSSRKTTLWLAPEPKNAIVRLQAALQAA